MRLAAFSSRSCRFRKDSDCVSPSAVCLILLSSAATERSAAFATCSSTFPASSTSHFVLLALASFTISSARRAANSVSKRPLSSVDWKGRSLSCLLHRAFDWIQYLPGDAIGGSLYDAEAAPNTTTANAPAVAHPRTGAIQARGFHGPLRVASCRTASSSFRRPAERASGEGSTLIAERKSTVKSSSGRRASACAG